MKDVKFNMFELIVTNEQKVEIKETEEINGIGLKPLMYDIDIPMLDNIGWNRLFSMPKVEGMAYGEIMLKCVAQLFCNLTNGLDKSARMNSDEDFERIKNGEGITKENIHIEYRHLLASLGCVVQYIMNCSSFRNGEFYSFDAFEIMNKLDTLSGLSNMRISKEEYVTKGKDPSFEAITTHMVNISSVPIYEGIKLGVSIDIILEKIENKEIDYHTRFFYIKFDSIVKFYTYQDLR